MPCIHDNAALYLFLSALDLLIYISPCITERSVPRKAFVALNIAFLCNLLIALHTDESVGVTFAVLAALFAMLLAIYSLAGSLILLSGVTLALGFSVAALNAYATDWILHSTGMAVSDTVLYIIFISTSLIGIYISYALKSNIVLNTVIDCVIFSVLATIAINYLVYLSHTDWPSRSNYQSRYNITQSTVNTTVIPLNDIELEMLRGGWQVICCDDDNVICPLYLKPSSMLITCYLFIFRVLMISGLTAHRCNRQRKKLRVEATLAEPDSDDDDIESKNETVPLVKTRR